MKTKILELKDDQYLYVYFNSKELVNYINRKTDIAAVKMTHYIQTSLTHCGEEEKALYPAKLIRHGRPLDYKYCVLKVNVGFATALYFLCKNIEMRQAKSEHPCIYLKSENVVTFSIKKSKCIEAYDKKKEQYLEKHKPQKEIYDTAFFGCHTKAVGPVSLEPSCHNYFTGCHGISR